MIRKAMLIFAAAAFGLAFSLPAAQAGGTSQFGYQRNANGGKAKVRCGKTGCYERKSAK